VSEAIFVRFEVLSTVAMKISVFGTVFSSSLVERYKRVGETYLSKYTASHPNVTFLHKLEV
jgi:hypothetical protein